MPWGFAAAALGAAVSAYGASQQNKAARAGSREQMDFQERMSSTSYQRSMADMRAAGLNPMLAYQQGGASTPGGAQPNVVNPTGTELGGVASSALATRRMNQELKSINAEVELKDAMTTKTNQDTIKIHQETKNLQVGNKIQEQNLLIAFQTWMRGQSLNISAMSAAKEAQLWQEFITANEWAVPLARAQGVSSAGIGAGVLAVKGIAKKGGSIMRDIQRGNRRSNRPRSRSTAPPRKTGGDPTRRKYQNRNRK